MYSNKSDMEGKPGHKILIRAGLFLIIVIHLLHVRYYFFLTDDSFISFRYVVNWVNGQGLVFNPGERVEGYTNFLWVVILAAFRMIGIAPEWIAPFLSILCSLLLLGLVYYFPRIALGEKEPRPGWLIAPLLLALNRSYAVWATGGLETRLFTLLVFAGAIMAWRALDKDRSIDILWSAVLLALAELTRPEGALYLLSVSGSICFLRLLQKKRPLSFMEAIYIFSGIAIIASHFLGRYAYYGAWFPNTFYTKVNKLRLDYGILYLMAFMLEYSLYVFIPPAVIHLFRALRGKKILPWFFLICFSPYLVYILGLGGDHFEYRFLDPILPVIAVFIGQGLRGWTARPRAFTLATFLFCIFLVYYFALPWASGIGFGPQYRTIQAPEMDLSQRPYLKLLPGFPYLCRLFSKSEKYLIDKAISVRAEEHRLFGRQQVERGTIFHYFVKRGYLRPDDVICINVIGAIPYFSGLKTIDYHGLTDPYVARLPPDKDGAIFHEKSALNMYIKDKNVDFFFSTQFMDRARADGVLPVLDLGMTDKSGRFDNWEERLYLVQLDYWLLFFRTPHPPLRVLERFDPLGVPIYMYYGKGGSKLLPEPLAELIKGGKLAPY